jgi:glycerol uptake facilitator protein
MSPYIAEFVGTLLLIILGNGVVANVVLQQTKGNGAGWLVIAAGWGVAVFVGAFCAASHSGAHLNPAVTIAMVMAGKTAWSSLLGYIMAQFLGAMLGAVVIYVFYREHFAVSENADDKLACFCTSPAIRNNRQAFLCEAVGTFALVLPVFLMQNPSIQGIGQATEQPATLGLGTLGALPVGLLVFGIGLSLGGPTGYAINPARDIGPRLVHWLLAIPGKRDSDWNYAWVPGLGPIAGALGAAVVYQMLGTSL